MLFYSSTTLYYKVLLRTTPVLLCIRKYYSVLHSTTPVLLCTTKYYSSTTLYYTVLLQYYSVLQSTTPVLLRTTQYYSSTTLYILQNPTPVLLCTRKYYSVLHSTTPVLLCTTKYDSSTTLYYKVLLQYYSVLQSTTPVLLRDWTRCTREYGVHRPSQVGRIFAYRATVYYSSTTLYYKVLLRTTPVLLQYYSVLQSATLYYKVILRTTQYYSSTTLYLYYKILLQYYSLLQSTTPVLLQYYSVLQSATPYYKVLCTPYWKVLHEMSFTMRGTTNVIVQPHQILRLPRKMILMIDPRHIWNVIYNARSNRGYPPTSPNAAPATKNDSHDWSLSHMKRYLQCAEQQVSLFDLTKYCACHKKWQSKISEKIWRKQMKRNLQPNRSEHDPRMIRPWSGHETVSPQPASRPR